MKTRARATVYAILLAAMATGPGGGRVSANDASCGTGAAAAVYDLRPSGGAPAAPATAGALDAALSPERTLRADRAARPLQEDGWQTVATLSTRVNIPAGDRAVVRFDHAHRRLEETRPDIVLTGLALAAVDRAPDWLADALADNLGRLSEATQDSLARLVLDADDPIVDEVAFQIAHLGKGPLTDRRFDAQLLVDNARLMYEHDRSLAYVEIVDHGSASEGGDYYSTTRYRVVDPERPGEIDRVEIPSDVYYWFVVHPKLSDETVKASGEASSEQATYGYFWREYLFANPDPGHDYAESGGRTFPVLGEVLRVPTVLWDGQAVDLEGGRPFEPDDVALDVIGNWVSTVLPQRASGNRPVQPNQIACEHNGNCGEIQDLLGAASRTALVPNVLTSDHCEDHVWNEFYTPLPTAGWFPYQVDWAQGPTRINRDNVAYDKDRGGSKDVSGIWAWRSDGFAYDVVDRYSKACGLVVKVTDSAGKPVDGARVIVYNEAWSGTGYSLATFGLTDADGRVSFRLGDLQNYWIRVTSNGLGTYPPQEGQIAPVINQSEADQTYTFTAELAGALRTYADRVREESREAYRLTLRYEATHEVVLGASPFGTSLDFSDWRRPGQVDMMVFDARNFAAYDRAASATAQAIFENSIGDELTLAVGDGLSDRYVVFSNEDHVANSQLVNIDIALQRNTSLTTPSTFLPFLCWACAVGRR